MKSRGKSESDSAPALGLQIEQPGASARMPISVRDLTATIREVLEESFDEVWVAGEISNLRAPASGHLYFTLKDATATLRVVMFRNDAARIGFTLRDGLAVVVRGAVTVYEARGEYQLQAAEVRTRGEGSLQQRFEELKRRLEAEGLFALERKRPLPVFPESIGVVTSLQGAVLHDMLQILQRRAPGIRIFVRGVRVQGPEAAPEIADAIGTFSEQRAVDVVVVARGGGSMEDLWAFNEEVVARAIATCSLPTISAVGHETDFTIADFVADLRAPTPSAAAELLTRDWSEWRQEVAKLSDRLDRNVRQVLAEQRRHLARLGSSYALREPRRVVRQFSQRIDELRESLHAGAKWALESRRQDLQRLAARLSNRNPARELAQRRAHLAHLAARLRTLGPQGTLDRGYALVLDAQGRPVSQATKALESKPVRLVLAQGTAEAKVIEAQPDQTLADALQSTSSVARPKSSRKKR